MYPSLLLALLAISTKHVLGEKHHLYSGFFSGSQLYGIQYDDETSTLTVVNNITTNSSDGSKWIAIDVCCLFYFYLYFGTNKSPSGATGKRLCCFRSFL